MTAAVRIALRLFGIFPIQRWVELVGLVLVGVDVVAKLAGWRFAGALHPLGYSFVLLAAIATAGYLFRGQSAIRAHGLAPSARTLMLAGLALHIGLLVGAFSLSLIIWPGAAELSLTIENGVVYPLFFLTWIYLGLITATRSIWSLWTVVLASAIAGYWIGNGGLERLAPLGLSTPYLAAGAIVVAWSVFIGWYLSARTIDQTGLVEYAGTFRKRKLPEYAVPRTARSAVTAIVTGQFPAPLYRYLMPIAAASVTLVCAIWILSRVGAVPRDSVNFAPLLSVVFIVGVQVNQIARRMRYVWLKHEATRIELFRIAERRALMLFGLMLLMLGVLLFSLAAFSSALPSRNVLAIFALMLSSGLVAMYIGLMHVTSRRAIDFSVAGFFMIVSLFSTILMEPPISAFVPAAVVLFANLAAAAVCRAVAIRRWRHVDWLRLKPSPWLEGALGRAKR